MRSLIPIAGVGYKMKPLKINFAILNRLLRAGYELSEIEAVTGISRKTFHYYLKNDSKLVKYYKKRSIIEKDREEMLPLFDELFYREVD